MRKRNAYFTVEAALILPLVMSALLLVTFLVIFQYDRCLLEQDMGLLAVYAGTVRGESETETARLIRNRAAELSREKYVAWETEGLWITVEKGGVRIEGEGRLNFPLPEWNLFHRDNVWEAKSLRRTVRVSPVDFIRIYRRIQEETEDADGVCEKP